MGESRLSHLYCKNLPLPLFTLYCTLFSRLVPITETKLNRARRFSCKSRVAQHTRAGFDARSTGCPIILSLAQKSPTRKVPGSARRVT